MVRKIVVEGGKGGLGNWNFKSPTNQTPRYAQPGISGVEKKLTIEFKNTLGYLRRVPSN